ncbi:MAG: hypothetical protein M5U01_19695 [Ardenticatenaceae bacterium]|nr:hypothetical protein [Ardenticatenaceae bacterium]
MLAIAIGILALVAEAFCDVLAESATAELKAKLLGDPTRKAFQHALGAALHRYATSGSRLSLAQPLLDKKGPLTQREVVEELTQIVRFVRDPNYQLIGERWKWALVIAPTQCNFTDEAQVLVDYLRTELRATDVFRPVFDSKDLRAIATHTAAIAASTAASAQSLSEIQKQLGSLATLLDTRLAELSRAFLNAPFNIRDEIRDDSAYIEEKTRDFVGRKFVFNAIDQFVYANTRGYFFIRGDPGVGKTALAAQLIRTRGYVHHFNRRTEGISTADQFLRNLCAQLIARYNLPHPFLPPSATQDNGFLTRLLTEISSQLLPDEKVIVVLDALDEADKTGLPQGANPLYLPGILPPRIFFVVTMRREEQPSVQCESEPFDIDDHGAENAADIREYLRLWLSRPSIREYIASQGITDQIFVETMKEKSENNFIYLRYVLPEIERGTYSNQAFDVLPRGLENYYEDQWKRMQVPDVEEWFRYKLPVIMALTLEKRPMSIGMIAEFSGVPERSRIRAVLKQWDQFLHKEPVEEASGMETGYSLYHASFHDFLAKKDEIRDEWLQQVTKIRIARAFLSRVKRND